MGDVQLSGGAKAGESTFPGRSTDCITAALVVRGQKRSGAVMILLAPEAMTMTLDLLDHETFPDFHEDDPAFTALMVKDQEAEGIECLMWIDRRLNEIEGPELKTDVHLSV